MKVDKALCESVMRLRAQEFRPFTDWIEQGRVATLERLTVAPADDVPKLQGRAQLLKELLDLIESAPAVLGKMEGQPARM